MKEGEQACRRRGSLCVPGPGRQLGHRIPGFLQGRAGGALIAYLAPRERDWHGSHRGRAAKLGMAA